MKKLLLTLLAALAITASARAANTNTVFYLTNDWPVGVQAYIVWTNPVVGTAHFNNIQAMTQPIVVLPGTITNLGTIAWSGSPPPLWMCLAASNAVFGTGAALVITNWQSQGTASTTITFTNSVSFSLSLTNGANYVSLPPPPLY